MKRLATAIALGLLAFAPARGMGIKEWEMKTDPPVSGKQIVTVRMTPSATAAYDQFVFECTLRQEYMKEDSSGTVRKRAVEPAVFVFLENNVKLVEDLDKHISFWVPISVEEAQRAFGESLFVTNAPVTISKVKVKVMNKGALAWTFESPPSGIHKPAPAAPAKKPAARP